MYIYIYIYTYVSTDKTASLKLLLFSDSGSECVVVLCKMLAALFVLYVLGAIVAENQAPLAVYQE
jgi:hypothetical protein